MNKIFVNINLLPQDFIRLRELRENKLYLYLSLLMAVFLTLTPFLFLQQENLQFQNALNDANLSLQEYEKYKPQIKKIEEEIEDIKKKRKALVVLLGSRSIWLARILEIGKTLPSKQIYLTNFSPGTDTPEIKGEISLTSIPSAGRDSSLKDGFENLRNFAVRINSLKYLEGASVTQCDRDNEKKKLIFTVVLKIKG